MKISVKKHSRLFFLINKSVILSDFSLFLKLKSEPHMGQEDTSELVDELGLGIDSEITYIKWSNIDKDVSFNIPKLSRFFLIF